MDKAFTVLEILSIVEGKTATLSAEHLKILEEAEYTIARLFLWEEDLLGEQLEFRLLLCKSLGWYRDVLETLEMIGHDPKEYVREVHSTFEDLSLGDPITGDMLDELAMFCLMISEAIWNHFISLHIGEVTQN